MATASSSSGSSRTQAGGAQADTRGTYTPQENQLAQHVLPQSAEAEVCVLGSMVLEANTIDIVVHIVKTDDFFRPANRIIFETLVRMHNAGKPIDLVTLNEELQREKLIDRVGGADYLVSVAEGVPSTANAEYYARMVRDKAMLRSLISATGQVTQDAYESQDEPAEIIDRAEHAIFQIASRQVGDHAVSLEILMQHTFEMLDKADGSVITGIATGYHRLDELTCGLQNGEMIVMAARPSMGKTALACNMAEYMGIRDKRPVLLFSLEMSKEQLAMRFLASHAKFNMQRLRRGNLNPEQWTQVQMAADDLEKAPIFIDDSADLNVLRLRAKARRMKAAEDIQCVFVDYLQLMGPMSSGRNESRQQQIAEMSRGLKALARELGVPVVVLSQLNRGPESREGHRPRMSDLRESGAIEQDADVVMLLHREDYYHQGEPDYDPTGVTDLIIAKQRNGPTGTVKLTFVEEYVRFEDHAPESAYGS